MFPILVRIERDKFKEYLYQNGVESGIHFPILISNQKAMSDVPFLIYGNLKRATGFVTQELSIPINPTMTLADARKVVKICNSWKPI